MAGRGVRRTGDGDRVSRRVAATAAALAAGSLAVGSTIPWVTGALAVAAMAVFRPAERS